VAPKGSSELGRRAEIKNLNSFRSIERAVIYEYSRQVELLEKGETVVQETRGWHDAKQITFSQRSKENAQDYRYMPDPDIPSVELTDDYIIAVQSTVPMLPPEYRAKWESLGVDNSVVNSLLNTRQFADAVTEIQVKSGDSAAKRTANWFASAVGISDEEVTQQKTYTTNIDDLITLTDMTDKAEISSGAAKELFNELLNGATNPRALAESKNLLQVSDEGAVGKIVDAVLADPASAASVADIRAGKDKAIGYLVGQVMKQSQGKANPAMAQKLIRAKL